jgi:hypothetical protein
MGGGKRTVEERLDGERDELGEGKVDGHIVMRLSWYGWRMSLRGFSFLPLPCSCGC